MTAQTNRHVRSFVLRQGRISRAQQRAYDELLPRYGVPYQESALNLDELFGRSAPKILEIGFGMGDATAQIAQDHPENDYLAVEVHTPGVGSLLKKIGELNLCNIRIIQHDAVEMVRHMLTPNSLAGIHIFFPDPWPKKRHHKRRLIQPEFVSLLASRLKTGGHIHVATDWQEYAEHVLAVLGSEPWLANAASGSASRPPTKFEQRGMKLGHGVWDIVFRRV